MKILLAEDDFATRKFMVSFLSKYGECDVTVDGMDHDACDGRVSGADGNPEPGEGEERAGGRGSEGNHDHSTE